METFVDFCDKLAYPTGLGRAAGLVVEHAEKVGGCTRVDQLLSILKKSERRPIAIEVEMIHDLWDAWLKVREWCVDDVK